MSGFKNNMDNMTQGTSIVERTVALVDKYGLKKIFKGLIVMLLISYAIFFALNPTYFIDRYNETMEEKHSKQLNERMEMVEMTNNEIERLKIKTNADRVFIIEFHNSVKSIEGFPFAFGSMNFETCQDNVVYVSDEYTNFNLSKYKLISYLYKNNIYKGSVEGIKEIDNRLYLKFLSNDVAKIYLIKIEGVNLPTGILGVSYCDPNAEVDDDSIMSLLRQEAVRMGIIMSNKDLKHK